MDAIAESIRQELLRLLAEPLTAKVAAKVARLAGQAAKLLPVSASGAIAEVLADPSSEVDEPSAADTAETTGMRAVKELLANAPVVIAAYNNAPDRLTLAIATARGAGMTDVADELERRLMGAVSQEKPYLRPKLFPLPAVFTAAQPGVGEGLLKVDGE